MMQRAQKGQEWQRGRTAPSLRRLPLLPLLAGPLGALLLLLTPPLAAQTARRYTVTLRGTPDDSMVEVVRRTVELANTHGRARIIVRIAVDSAAWDPDGPAARIAGQLEQAQGPVYALVDTAWGGGVLVALAADSVFMRPDGSVGAGPQRSPAPAGAAGDSLRARLVRLLARHGPATALGAALLAPAELQPGRPAPGIAARRAARGSCRNRAPSPGARCR